MSNPDYRVVLTRKASAEVEQLSDWWARERPAAPQLPDVEAAKAVDMLQTMPSLGRPLPPGRVRGIRRPFLRRIGYHNYYQIDELDRCVTIPSIWPAQRGKGPSFVCERRPASRWRGSAASLAS